MAEQWYVGRSGRQSGPFSWQQLRQMAGMGQVSKSDLVWKDGMAGWSPASSIAGLFTEAGPSAAESALRPTPRPAAPPPRLVPAGGVAASRSSPEWAADTMQNAVGPGDPGGGTNSGALAEFLPRVGATLLDSLFLLFISGVPSVGLTLTAAVAGAGDPEATRALVTIASLCGNLIGFVIQAVYYVVLDSSAKQGTWGKQIVGLKVTDLEGRRISAGRALGRFLARCLSGCTCGIGFLLPLFTDRKQTLHDLISGCLVVRT